MIKHHLTDETTTVNHNIDPHTDTEGHMMARRPGRQAGILEHPIARRPRRQLRSADV